MFTEILQKTLVKSLHLKNVAQGFFYISAACFQGSLIVKSMTYFKIFNESLKFL